MPNEFSDENYNREYVWVAIIQVAAAACVPKHSQRISKGRVSFADVIWNFCIRIHNFSVQGGFNANLDTFFLEHMVGEKLFYIRKLQFLVFDNSECCEWI